MSKPMLMPWRLDPSETGLQPPVMLACHMVDEAWEVAEPEQAQAFFRAIGARIARAYPLGEAEQLLGSKLEAAQQSLANCEEDIDFLREQITVRLTALRRSPGSWHADWWFTDYGGRYCESVQLGCGTAAEGEA